MKRLSLNREYAWRHLFVTLVLVSLGAWFGYDGLVRYPKMDAAALYKSIEGSDAPTGYKLESFKEQKTQTQYGFAILSLLGALVVGKNLLSAARFRFAYDDDGFAVGEKRYGYDAIKSIDVSAWQKKDIIVVSGEGFRVKLDAWHHVGVREFAEKIIKKEEAK